MDPNELFQIIHGTLSTQQFGVLATIFENQPHTSLVAIAATNNLRSILFLTSRESRKYRNCMTNPAVAMLLDERPQSSDQIEGAVAISAFGMARPIARESADATCQLFAFRHPDLAAMVSDPHYSLMTVSVQRYEIANNINKVFTFSL